MLDIHKENLQKSGLTPDTIERLMIRDVSPHKIKLNGVNSAYEIPYFQLDAKPNCFTRQRLFPPIQRNGHTQKYYQAKGTDPHPYLPPLSNLNWQAIANDPSQPIRITEGEKKAAALCQKAIACMGIGGVWNWRIKQDNNERLTCPELDQIIWQDREIEIIPDSDGWREAKLFDVLAGFYALAMDLVQRGARVKFVELPELIPGAKTGLDDWLVKKGELWHWEWESLERVSMDNPRLRKLAKWWQNWNLRQFHHFVSLGLIDPIVIHKKPPVFIHGKMLLLVNQFGQRRRGNRLRKSQCRVLHG